MNIFASTGPRGDPIATRSVCLYILLLNVHSTSDGARLMSFRNKSSGIFGFVSVSSWRRAILPVVIISPLNQM